MIPKKPKPEKNDKEIPLITEKYISEICEFNGGYKNPEYNFTCYLHFGGFRKIENLDAFKNLTVLYLDNNNIEKIENLDNLKHLVCLYLQNNYISKIENLENNKLIANLNLSGNKIRKLENLHTLPNLENLYLQNNFISTPDDIENLLQGKNISLLDLQNNTINAKENVEKFIFIFNKIPKLKVLYFKGNDIIKNISNYRRKMITKLPQLTYLDDRPIKEEDRAGAIAYLNGGGYKAETQARKEIIEKNDKLKSIREREKNDLLIPFSVKKERTLKSINNEYLLRKEKLLLNKNKILDIMKNKNTIGFDLDTALFSIDYQLYENELFKINEEKLITLSISKRELCDDIENNFIYEKWMDEIIEVILTENVFDFETSLNLVLAEFKKRGVKNWQLFTELDLRNAWKDIELKNYLDNSDSINNNFILNHNQFLLNIEDVFNEEEIKNIYSENLHKAIIQNNETGNDNKFSYKNTEDENDNRIVKSNGINIKEGKINDEIFANSKSIFDSEKDVIVENKKNKNEVIVEHKKNKDDVDLDELD